MKEARKTRTPYAAKIGHVASQESTEKSKLPQEPLPLIWWGCEGAVMLWCCKGVVVGVV